jgi:hypothetical protein
VAGGFSPLDEELGLLPQGSLTPTLAESVVRLGAWIPFGVAARMLEHFVHTQVSEATVTRLTERAGAAYEAEQEAQAARLHTAARPAAVQGPPLQLVRVDGAFVPLVHKQWTEAKTLVIGTVQAPQRQADGTLVTHTRDRSYFSRVLECHAFTTKATIETARRGTPSAGRVAGVVDGAVWEQDFLAVQCPAAVRILDWPHAVGYLAKVAQALYGGETRENHVWLALQRETLLQGDPEVVLQRLRGLQADLQLQAGAGPPPPALAVLTESLDYLAKRAAMLCYAAFRAAGYPIGSGAVESANKLVVEARLKGAGMHWALAHVNPRLALRGMACSDRWEEAWPQLVHQWRVQARTMVLLHRAHRQAAQEQVTRDVLLAPEADAPHARAVVASATVPQDALPLQGRAPSRRPAALHPWHARLLRPRSPAHPNPGM